MTYDHPTILDAIKHADFATLEDLANHWDEFPSGVDTVAGTRWITHAIDYGTAAVVSWMLSRGASPSFDTEDGYTVLHSAIERNQHDKYRMMRDLIAAGADVNGIGIHGHTPAHLAAVRNDVEALRVLHESGADFRIRTSVDDYYTPLEEARSMIQRNASEAIEYLETIEAGITRPG